MERIGLQQACQRVKVAIAVVSTLALSPLLIGPGPAEAAEAPTRAEIEAQAADAGTPPSGVADAEVTRPGFLESLAYTPGRGLRIGDSGLVLGGYSSIELSKDEGEPAELLFEDLSFFIIYDAFDRFSFFSELELEDLISVDTNGDVRTDGRFEVERLYGDIRFSDQLQLRVGKFLTPVGRWNVIHAQPLVWTTSRPIVTEDQFDENTTGLMLGGEALRGRLSYAIYGQFTDQFEPTPQTVQSDRSGGTRIELEILPRLSVGGSYLAFRSEDEWFHLVGADALWQRGRFEWMTEVSFDTGAGSSGSQWGLYSQLVAEVAPRLYAVGRYEFFSPRGAERRLNQVVVGGAYRVRPYAIFKLEYLFADHSSNLSQPGFRTSFALLF